MKKVLFLVGTVILALSLLASLSASAAPAIPPGRVVYDAIPIADFRPSAINNCGQVAGATLDGFPAIWDNGRIIRMPFSARGTAVAINDLGSVIVAADWGAPTSEYLFVDRRGWVGIINVPGNYDVALSLNNRNQVVGITYADNYTRKGFIWRYGRVTFLNNFGYWWLCDINSRGQIVANDGAGNNFIWQNGRVHVLETPDDGGRFEPRAINDCGRIVGSNNYFYSSDDDDGESSSEYYPVCWQNGKFTLLETFGQKGLATAINNRGEILGYTEKKINAGIEHLMLWRPGRQPLLIDQSISQPFVLDRHYLVSDMNNDGQIICNGFLDGQYGYYLLQPRYRR